MTFLNPLALLFLPIIFWIFRELFKTLTTNKKDEFEQEHNLYIKQTKTLVIVLALLILALSRPAMVNEISKEKFEANEYILAIDSSYSMQMDDIKPSRYTKARELITSLLELDSVDRFTLFAFTSNPLLISPPTTDHKIIESALDAFEPKYILTKGTSLENLLHAISDLEQEHKSLLIFSDGGDEHKINTLLKIASSHAITLNIIAIASAKGTVVTKDAKPYKDKNQHLIVSRINPILKDLAKLTDGFYFEVNSADENIASDIYAQMLRQNTQRQKLESEVVSYKEFYFFPLFLAFILLLLSLTRLGKSLPFLALTLFISASTPAEASLFDFYYKELAKKAYEQKEYAKAAMYFKKLAPSQYSYMSLANSYYNNKQYKYSLRIYTQIKSHDPEIKSKVLYNMANAAFRLKKYQRAAEFYKQSLTLHYSIEAKENLMTLYALNRTSKVDVADMLPQVNDKEVKTITKKNDTKKDEQKNESGSSKSKQNAAQGSQGGAGAKSKKQNKDAAQIKGEKNNFKMGYNAYELINKGYINETQPW